jgi:hypothetical protein
MGAALKKARRAGDASDPRWAMLFTITVSDLFVELPGTDFQPLAFLAFASTTQGRSNTIQQLEASGQIA